MALLTGTISATQFTLESGPLLDITPAFDDIAFREINPASEARESAGFIRFPGADGYELGARRYGFRLRVDRRRPDATAVEERVRQMVETEMEITGSPFVGPKKRRQLKSLAEEELLADTSPRTSITECVLDGETLVIGSASDGTIGTVLNLLHRLGMSFSPKNPWLEREEEAETPAFMRLRVPGSSILGCRFLAGLGGSANQLHLALEPEEGLVRLQTPFGGVALDGMVHNGLRQHLTDGSEVVRAKVHAGEVSFILDGPTWRIRGLKVDAGRHDHWTQLLDARLEAITAAFELLDEAYARINPAGAP